MQMYWANFVTGEHDLRDTPTGDEALAYIPQWDAAQSMYKPLLQMGKSESDAMIDTLKACVGESR